MIEEEASRLAFRLLANEQDAYLDFQRIYRRLFLSMFRGLGFSPVDSQDLTATAITDICLIVAKWDPDAGNFDGWVRTVARNMGLGRLREREKTEFVTLVDYLDRPQVSTDSVDPRRERAVDEALAKLSPSDRILIEHRELEFENEKPYVEIAELICRISGKSVTEGALRVRHKRALDRLKEILAADPRIKLRQVPVSVNNSNQEKRKSA